MGQHIYDLHLDYTGSCYGPSPAVRKAMEDSVDKANSYPYEGYMELKKAIAKYYKVKPENVMVTNGCDEAIALITYLFGKRVLIQAPTYSEFERIAKGIKSEIRIIKSSIRYSRYEINFSKKDLSWATQTWVCTPNNPTGDITPKEKIIYFVKNTNGVIAVDEAYYEYCGKSVAGLVDKYENLIVTRTFSKAYATEGIRLGYIIANPKLISALENSTQEFNVNRAARAAGLAVFKSIGYYKKSMAMLHRIKNSFEKSCKSLGFKLIDHNSPFTLILFRSDKERDFYHDGLEKMGIYTLSNTHEEFTGFSDPCIRIAIGNEKQMQIAKKALEELSKEYKKLRKDNSFYH
jgi:histidinol-phosphate aminotransferase